MRALITEHGFNRGALAAARALRAAGWTVDVAASNPGLTSSSRAVRRTFAVPSPDEDSDGFVAGIARAMRDAGSDVVFPVDETQLSLLSRHRDRLPGVFPYAPDEIVRRATDRLYVADVARKTGLGAPDTRVVEPADLQDWHGPVVVKGRYPSLVASEDGASRVETRIGTPAQARTWIAELRDEGLDVVVQPLALGQLSSVTVLTNAAAQVVAESHQMTDRIWPVPAGVSTRARTIDADPDLSRRIATFLAELGWTGLVQLQFIIGRDGQARLIDFNPRFYGSLALAIAAGTNFPAMWAALATGRPVPPARPGRAGLRYHWLGGDLRRAARERQGGLVRDVGQSVRWGLPAVHPIWSAGDPVPALVCGATFVRGRARRLFPTADAPEAPTRQPRAEPLPEPPVTPVAPPEAAGVA